MGGECSTHGRTVKLIKMLENLEGRDHMGWEIVD
jgi:hypothetical protein